MRRLPRSQIGEQRVVPEHHADAALDVTLACSTGTPLAWTLVEAGELAEAPKEAPKPGRKRAAWAASDVVVEPSAGD